MVFVQLCTLKREYLVTYYVPFENKENAKKQGARWNPDLKVWYRHFTCYNQEDIKEVSAESCNLRIMDIQLVKEETMYGTKIKMDLNEEQIKEMKEAGCKIFE